MDKGITALYAAVFYGTLTHRDARGNEDCSSRHELGLPEVAIGTEGNGLLVWDTSHEIRGIGAGVGIPSTLSISKMMHTSLSMTEHLNLTRPAKKEQVSKGSILTADDGAIGNLGLDDEMQAARHELRVQAAHYCTAGVIVYIAKHGGEVARVISPGGWVTEADGIIVVIIPQGLGRRGMRGVVLGSLLL